MPSDFTEKPLTSRAVYSGRLLTVKEDEVELPDGGHARREYVLHPGAVVIIPMPDADTLLLEHQFRYPLRRHFLELPAGKIESGEPPEETAKRELLEETGYRARDWSFLTTLHPCVGYSDERIELFLARDLAFEGHPGEDDEFIETVSMSIDDALARIFAREITEAKTILGVLWADRLRRA
ncbi:MAG: NUDIX hydrolase [Burkholderiales bacterium]|nr:NUDIX hydrolase [Burkholderiales bacterium]